MNKLLIVANLKSYKTQSEALDWLEKFKIIKQDENILNDKEIIIAIYQ